MDNYPPLQPMEFYAPMDGPSTSADALMSDTYSTSEERHYTALEAAELASLESVCASMTEPAETHDDSWPECDSIDVVLALNEAYSELICQMIYKVERAIEENRSRQKGVLMKQQAFRESEVTIRRKVPVLQYLPPYFKDDNMMCPPLSEEAKRKIHCTTFDPLMKEEKKWSGTDLALLRNAVQLSMLQNRLQPLLDRRELVCDKIRSSGQDTSEFEMGMWKEELETLNNKISFERTVPAKDLLVGDYANVDWAKISNIDFNGSRSAAAIRLKWCNEQSPRWNKEPWTVAEKERLKELRETKFVSWAVLADRLGTRRTPWQCFEKYKSELQQSTKEWSQEEDEKLIALVNMLKINGKIQWDKVTYYMPGRQRQQVRTRFMRTLDKTVKHGKWTDQEDLLLMCAVNRVGAKDWSKVAKAVPGRTDVQCRDRWVSALDKRISSKDWSIEEDEKLLYAVSVFGRGNWSKCAQLLPGRIALHCRYRFQTLLSTKIRLCAAQMHTIGDGTNFPGLSPNCIKVDKYVRISKTYRRFNELVSTGDGSKVTTSALNSKAERARSEVTGEEKEKIDKVFKEISERYQRGVKPNITGLINEIPVEEGDLQLMLRAQERRCKSKFLKKPMHMIGGVWKTKRKDIMKIRKTQYLLADDIQEVTTFDDDVPEEERVMSMTEALCQAVRKYDQHQWNVDFRKKNSVAVAPFVTQFVQETMRNGSETAAECLRQSLPVPPDCSLAPTFASMNSYTSFERVRASLNKVAGGLFHKSDVSMLDPKYNNPQDYKETYTAFDRLNIKLTDDVTKSDEYLQLKARMRCVLLEPARIQFACETDETERRRIQASKNLVLREMEEEGVEEGALKMAEDAEQPPESADPNGISTDFELEEMQTEIMVGQTSKAIETTIDEVVQMVCHDTPEKKKEKRGRKPRKMKRFENDIDDFDRDDISAISPSKKPPKIATVDSQDTANEDSRDTAAIGEAVNDVMDDSAVTEESQSNTASMETEDAVAEPSEETEEAMDTA